MRAATLAGVPLDRRGSVDDVKFVAVLEDGDAIARHDGNYREGCAGRLPAFGAAAGVVMCDVALDADLDRLAVLAFVSIDGWR